MSTKLIHGTLKLLDFSVDSCSLGGDSTMLFLTTTIEGSPGLLLGLFFPAKIGFECPDCVLVVTPVVVMMLVVDLRSVFVEIRVFQEVTMGRDVQQPSFVDFLLEVVDRLSVFWLSHDVKDGAAGLSVGTQVRCT